MKRHSHEGGALFLALGGLNSLVLHQEVESMCGSCSLIVGVQFRRLLRRLALSGSLCSGDKCVDNLGE